ncbi:nicotinic acid mononucleotide adenyltransferase [Flavobacterium urocaniciphilum]|uniref:Nicotinic acid mononucleotide adenyltransferase n=1 Tax=Flavobacterium urocaniciphilum TaxID=1299341 RepID=A0A1H9DBB2_9FLAO|nr:nicotinic acid mononucleotide adenyltransferase [Flavobacterium urocaniciphilum]SEQ10028.1 hypothetical protein SAMN05444005_106107 [Flavobacterium urocaniciphilum]
MKTLKLLFVTFIAALSLSSCTTDVFINDYHDEVTLPELIEGYDLWYIDYNRTTGNGDVPFLSKAFTMSFLNGNLYANNNLVGIGSTGGGYGVNIGYYDFTYHTIRFHHNINGFYELEVVQIAPNEIKLIDHYQNTAYYLIGYQRSSFDYDRVFYDNMHYFLQEYVAWEKVYTSSTGTPNVFDAENYLKFVIGSNDTFRSSQDYMISNLNNIYWDYTGNYNIQNVPGNYYTKKLNLYYNTNDYEGFNITVLNDGRIRLYHLSSGTTYEFVGRGFIPIMRNAASRTKTNLEFKK